MVIGLRKRNQKVLTKPEMVRLDAFGKVQVCCFTPGTPGKPTAGTTTGGTGVQQACGGRTHHSIYGLHLSRLDNPQGA